MAEPAIQSYPTETVLMPDLAAMEKARVLRTLSPESNFKQLAMSSLDLLIDFFKVTVASLLSVFVPQNCPLLNTDTGEPVCYTDVTISNYNNLVGSNYQPWLNYNNTKHICRIEENFTDLNDYNKFVLGWNFITLAFMIAHYLLTWRRERFMINKLEISLTDSRIHLKDIIGQYPHIESRLQWYNRTVFYLSIWGMICQFINIIVSAKLVFSDEYYAGFRGVTAFLTQVLITATVMLNSAKNTFMGIEHKLAYSCIAFEPISYNSIDPNFKPQNHQN